MVRGKVYLVGAGPGDPELMTLKGMRLLKDADCVLFDRLANPEILKNVSEKAELIDVGKSSGDHRFTQEEINQLIVEKAESGSVVVRLKGGDPYLFGRGGEEALSLAERGISFEVVPGLTSAIAVPAGAGIPVTHRGFASSVTVVTGHEEVGKDESLDWGLLARLGGTLVVLMGVARLEENVAMLLSSGKDPKTPSAIIERGGSPEERVITAPLKEIVAKARSASVRPPAILVIGRVVGLQKMLRPLRIAILRPVSQLESSEAQALEFGFKPIPAPAISFKRRALPSDLLFRIDGSDCVVFTSATGVEMALEDSSVLERLKNKRVAAIGPKTASAIEKRGLKVAIMPESWSSAGLALALKDRVSSVLLLRSAQGSEELVSELLSAGINVDDLHLYDITASGDPRLDALIRDLYVDVFIFTSASTARFLVKRASELGLLDLLKEKLEGAVVAAIGPPTAAELKMLGVKVDLMPERYTFREVLEELKSYFSSGVRR